MKKILLTISSVFLLSILIPFSINAEEYVKEYVPEYDMETGELSVDRELAEKNTEIVPALDEMAKVIYVPESAISEVENPTSYYSTMNRSMIQDLESYNSTYGYEYFGTMDKGSMLQALYSEIDNVVKSFHVSTTQDASNLIVATIDFSEYGLSVDEATSVWNIYRMDNPLYYWLDYVVGVTEEKIALYTTKDYDTAAERTACNEIVYSAVEEYIGMLPENASDYTKVLAFHVQTVIVRKQEVSKQQDII